jgi:hypothetical protein
MHRTPFVVAATAAGLAGVLSYHTHRGSFANFASASVASSKHPHPAAGSSTGTGPSGASPTAGGGSSVPTPLIGRLASGSLVQYGYGELSVQVTVSGGRITAVRVIGLRTADQYSQSLALQVIPTLRSEVLQAQSANINGVSGATYTSEAFASSLQSALSRLEG